jgi:hypothetical protein
MNIKEFYITDLNGESGDEFWSADKIAKLNENFNSLKYGLMQGQPGYGGPIGVGGGVGTGGIDGNTGPTGDVGPDGSIGLNPWERVDGTSKTKLKQRGSIQPACVILGYALDSSSEIVQTGGTFVEGAVGGAKPSALRINAVDMVGTSTQRNHIELRVGTTVGETYINFTDDGTTPTLKINEDTEIKIQASNFNLNDALYLTDNGIVIDSSQIFFGNLTNPIILGVYDDVCNVTITGDVTLSHLAATGITGNAIKTLYGYTPGCTFGGACAGNVDLYDLAGSFTGFPLGSIISISENEYMENFFNDYNSSLRWTGINAHGGQCHESEHGKGFGDYAGWYLCNGRDWQSYHINYSSPAFIRALPKLNTVNYDIDGTQVPSSLDYDYYSMSGVSLDFEQIQGNTLKVATPDGGNNIHELGSGWCFQCTNHSPVSLNNKIFICWLGEDDLYWYSCPPMPLDPGPK